MSQVVKTIQMDDDERNLIVNALCLYRWKFVDLLTNDQHNAIYNMSKIEHLLDTLEKL